MPRLSSLPVRVLLAVVAALSFTNTARADLGCEGAPTPANAALRCAVDADTTTPALIAKAQALGNDPDQIIAFVRTQIGFESYRGSLRGALGTLWSGAGNALDKANLAVALLRASNIPARYVRGTLTGAQQASLIASMFPNQTRVVGCPEPGTLRSTPTTDAALLAGAADHFWIEVQRNAAFEAVELSLPGAPASGDVGQRTAVLNEIPDALRHHITLRLVTELTGTGLAQGRRTSPVFEQRFVTAALVGRPASFGHYRVEATSGSIFGSGIFTYQPYLLIDGEVIGQPAATLPGAPYQEIFLGVMQDFVTLLNAEFDLEAPDGTTEHHERAWVDRLGPSIRSGVGSGTINVPDGSTPVVSDVDTLTVNVLAGRQGLDPIAAQQARTQPIAAEFSALLPTLTAIAANGVQTDADSITARRGSELSGALVRLATQTLTMSVAGASDQALNHLERAFLVRGYFDAPRLLVAVAHANETSVELKLDLRRTAVQAIPYPGQVADQAARFEFVRGLFDSALETEMMRTVTTTGAVHSAMEIFAALPAGIGIELIEPTSAALLDPMPFSDDVKARIRAALAAGNSVMVPTAPIPFDGGQEVAWFEIDGRTNYPIGVTADGGHQAAVEYSMIIKKTQEAALFIAGFGNGYSAGILTFIGKFLEEYSNGRPFEAAVKAGKKAISDMARIVKQFFTGPAKKGLGLGFSTAKWYVSYTVPGDPPVQPFLSAPFDAVTNPPVSGNAVDVAVRRDDLLYVDLDGAEVPTVYRAAVRNAGPTTGTFSVAFDTTIPGMTVVKSLSELTLAPGEVGEVGVCLFPTQGPPAPGVTGAVTAHITGPASGTGGTNVNTPEIHGLTVAATPLVISGAPGTNVVVDLTVASTGNVGETVPTLQTAPAGWTVQGVPAQLTLTSGEVRHVPVTIGIPAAATPGTNASITLGGDICANLAPAACPLDPPSLRDVSVTVQVRSAAVTAMAAASTCADTANLSALRTALGTMADAAAALEADPTDAAACRALRERTAKVCPLLQPLGMLDGVRAGLCAASVSTPCDGNTVAGLSQALAPVCSTLSQRIDASLVPAVTYAAPGSSAASALRLRGLGSTPVTATVALSQAANGLSVGGAAVQVPLNPGATVDVPLSLLAAVEGRYAFTVTASVASAPAVTTTVRGVHHATESVVNVMTVGAVPPYILSGGTTRITAAVANTVNVPLSARARVIIRRPNGDIQYQSPSTTLVALAAGGTLNNLQLDDVTASGWAEDLYRVEVQLLAQDGNPLPGGSGVGSLPVGLPVRARISADPVSVPPGTSEVDARITVESTLPPGATTGAAAPTDPTIDRIDWAAASRGASLSGRSPFNSNAPESILTDELGTGTELYVGNRWSQNESYIVDLGQTRRFDTVQFHLWDGDDRYYQYRVEVSADGTTWIPVADATTGEHRGLQRHAFGALDARYVRLTGTFSSSDVGLYLIDEFLVIGDASTAAEPTVSVTVDPIANGGATSAVGQVLHLHAGTYVIKHTGGAISLYPNDTDLGGKSWMMDLRVDVPVVNKSYRMGHVHDALTTYATASAAEAANLGRSFTLYLPVQADVRFYAYDTVPGDNRGSETFEVRQISGPNDNLVARMRDAVMRGALWEQPAIAAWQNWVSAADYGCMGCHEQTQASVGLEVSQRKLPDTPVDERLRAAFIDGYKTWQDAAGWVSPQHGGSFAITQTSLWAWAVSQFRDSAGDELAAPLMRGLDWLLTAQDASGGWVSDNNDGNASKLYFDGTPSATQTAAVIQATTRALDLTEGKDFIPFADVTISGNRVAFTRNPGFEVDVLLTPTDAVTAVKLSITDSFTASKNFVLGEIEFFDGDQKIPVSATVADMSQGGYPIANTIDGITRDQGNGWAHSPEPVSAATPADAVWTFSTPRRIDRIRIHQPYRQGDERGRGHQLKDYTIGLTGEAVPALNGAFAPAVVQDVGLRAPERRTAYIESLRRAARLLSGGGWDFTRNTRTAAQTIIGLQAALPWLDTTDRAAADARLAAAEGYLRTIQQSDGGWPDVSGPSRVFQTAQALEALVERSGSTVDPSIVAGAEFLLLAQRPDGRWLSSPLSNDTPGATTWVQIALPTIFENLSGLTLDVTHHVPSAGNAVINASIVPAPVENTTLAASTRLRWSSVLLGSPASRAFAVRTQVANMQPGEVRTIGTDSSVAFTSLAGSGTIALPPLTVAARHILSITPPTQTTAPATTVSYQVAIENVRSTDDTFTLSVLGLAPGSYTLPTTVPVPAGQTISVPLQVTVTADTPPSDLDLRVLASSTQGTNDQAGAQLLVRGTATPSVLSPLQAVHVALEPAQLVAGRGMSVQTVVRVTNLGDATATFDLGALVSQGVTASLSQSVITVLPGVANAQTLTLTLTSPANLATPTSVPFTVSASAGPGGASGNAIGNLTLLTSGVDVTLLPGSSTAPNTLQLHVRNIGLANDSFALALSGPLAGGTTPAALLAQSSVTDLAPGAETTVQVSVDNVSFATASALPLTAIATSTVDQRITDADTATVTVPTRHALSLALDAECRAAATAPVTWAASLQNNGTVEERFDLAVVATSGDAEARFVSPTNGALVTTLTGIRLPSLASALASLRVNGTTGSFTIALQGVTAVAPVTARLGCDTPTTSSTTSSTTTSTTTTTTTTTTAIPTTSTSSTTVTTSTSTASTTTVTATTSTTTTSTLPILGCEFQSRRRSSVRSDTHVLADLTVNDPRGTLWLGRKVTLVDGTRVAADRVLIGSGVHVFDVAANRLRVSRGAIVAGTTSTATLPLRPDFCPAPATAPTCGSTPALVMADQTLPPGTYGDLILSNRAHLTLQPGEYTFCSIRTGREAAILAPSGAVQVIVAGDVRLGTQSTIGNERQPLRLFAGGRRVTFDRDGTVNAFITAPRARLHVRDQAQLAGGFCSDRALIGRRVSLRCLADRP